MEQDVNDIIWVYSPLEIQRHRRPYYIFPANYIFPNKVSNFLLLHDFTINVIKKD